MTSIWRSVVWGIALSSLAIEGRAQSSESRSPKSRTTNDGRLRPDALPFRPAVTSLGIVSGYYYEPNVAFRPHPLSGYNPFTELRQDSAGTCLPSGQEGLGGMMLPHSFQNDAWAPRVATPPRANNSARADELVELGDRSFRGGNTLRAEERYKLAARANIETPVPHLHLTQIALIRGDYSTAAGYLRDAIASTRETKWLLETPDIQSMYGEPGDFARQLARLESWLQTHPDDRNGWFVLGAENYLSGHHQVAADAFLRLSDRKPDEALAAFAAAAAIGLERSKLEFSAATH